MISEISAGSDGRVLMKGWEQWKSHLQLKRFLPRAARSAGQGLTI